MKISNRTFEVIPTIRIIASFVIFGIGLYIAWQAVLFCQGAVTWSPGTYLIDAIASLTGGSPLPNSLNAIDDRTAITRATGALGVFLYYSFGASGWLFTGYLAMEFLRLFLPRINSGSVG